MNNELKAIYNEDLEELLQSVNELEPINNGERFCKECGTPISLNNIQMVIPKKGQPYEYVCDSVICVENYHES
jgi:hypothetical protein